MGGIGGDPSFPGLCPIVAPQPLPWGAVAFPAPVPASRLAGDASPSPQSGPVSNLVRDLGESVPPLCASLFPARAGLSGGPRGARRGGSGDGVQLLGGQRFGAAKIPAPVGDAPEHRACM